MNQFFFLKPTKYSPRASDTVKHLSITLFRICHKPFKQNTGFKKTNPKIYSSFYIFLLFFTSSHLHIINSVKGYAYLACCPRGGLYCVFFQYCIPKSKHTDYPLVQSPIMCLSCITAFPRVLNGVKKRHS